MAVHDIIGTTQRHMTDVFNKLNKAVVFIDNDFAECVHWIGGAPLLLSSGAIDIKQYSSFEGGKANQPKAVFLISQPIADNTEQVLCDILKSSHFEYAIVFCSAPPALHTLVKYGHIDTDEYRAFHQLEELMLDCMGSKNFTAEIHHIPIVCAAITRDLFTLPGNETFFPILAHEWKQLFSQANVKILNPSPADLDSSELPILLQRKAKLLAYSLNGVLELMGVADDVYSFGDTSRLVATELANLTVAKPRRKNSQKKASIVIVDRTVDLNNVVGHHGESLLDKIRAVNDTFPDHHNDVIVNMVEFCKVHSSGSNMVLPGCLAHNADHTAKEAFDVLASGTQKEALYELKVQLEEAMSADDLDVALQPGAGTLEFLKSNISAYSGKSQLLRQRSGLLQLIQAVVHTLQHPSLNGYSSLLGIEKGLLQSIADDMSAPLNQIIDLLDKFVHTPENERTHSLGEILGLLVYVYALYPNVDILDSENEQQLKPLLVRALMETSTEKLPSCVTQFLNGQDLADVVTEYVSHIMRTLRSLTQTRQHFHKFRHAYKEDVMTTLTPILEQLTQEIFAPNSKQEVPDLEYKSTGFRDLLKSGFGLFMNVSKPRPNDHPLLIIFILGGVTSSEAALIQKAAQRSNTTTKVIVGSTRLVTPTEIVDQLFAQQPAT